MKLFNIVILIFLLCAFTVGISINELEWEKVDASINNVSQYIENINITSQIPQNSSIPNVGGVYNILDKYIKFVGTLGIEVMRGGIKFGYDNPNYFEPEYIIRIMKLIVILVIVTLLIKPLMYLVILIIMIGMWIRDKLKKKRKSRRKK